VYKDHPAGAADPLQKPLGVVYSWMENKFYFDELYQVLFIRPSMWLSETFTYQWMDRGLIDGSLHSIAHLSEIIGKFLRTVIDKTIINGFGDFVGDSSKKIGVSLRVIQTGQIQQYMIAALIFVFGALIYFLYSLP